MCQTITRTSGQRSAPPLSASVTLQRMTTYVTIPTAGPKPFALSHCSCRFAIDNQDARRAG